ncbi:hypothetical protein Tco_0211798 [Tanacetum coccineum]
MVTEILCAFKGQSFTPPSGSVSMPTLTLIDVLTTIRGEGGSLQIVFEEERQTEKKRKLPLNLKWSKSTWSIRKLSKEFLKHQDAHLQVLIRAHNEKLKKKVELRNKRFDSYVWTVTNRYKPERITDIYIHPRIRPVTVTVYRNNDPRNFKVHKEFKFSDFGLSEWDELIAILPKKSNKCVGDMITTLSNKYERLKEIPNELGLDLTLPLPE